MNTVAKRNITYRALLASDDKALVTLLPTIMAPAGYDVTAVARGCYDESAADQFDILIIDGDPHHTFGQGLPAVVAVAPTDIIAAYDKGVDLVISKPLRAKVFMVKIRAILRRYGIEI